MSNVPGRILGLDAGERRIGVAISDPGRSFALPLDSILADGTELDRLADLVAREGVSDLVVGLPLSLSGESSAQTERARAFAAKARAASRSARAHVGRAPVLARGGAPDLVRQANAGRDRSRRARPRREAILRSRTRTRMAASIILQAYLDSMRFERP